MSNKNEENFFSVFCSRVTRWITFSFCLESSEGSTCRGGIKIEVATGSCNNFKNTCVAAHTDGNRFRLSHHFPRGLVVKPTHAKWNHSMEHWKRKKKSKHTVVAQTNHFVKTKLFKRHNQELTVQSPQSELPLNCFLFCSPKMMMRHGPERVSGLSFWDLDRGIICTAV